MPDVLIVGVSTRPAADSAARAGFAVTALDAFGDLDQSPGVRALSMPRDFGMRFTASSAARVADTIRCDAVAYLSSFENHPRAVHSLSRGRSLWGNPPAVLKRVRDPWLLAAALDRRGVPAPLVIPSGAHAKRARSRGIAVVPTEGPLYREERDSSSTRLRRVPGAALRVASARNDRSWLLKPFRSGGGHGIREWTPGTTVPRGYYVQERIDGVPGSITFVAAGGRAIPHGLTRQIVGDAAFGASGFRYCGNILLAAADPLLVHATELACVVSEEFGLVGVNGIDFVARDGMPYPVEVNPRYSASMELVERAYGVSVFATHAAACTSGDPPSFDLGHVSRGAPATGKAIVFARHDIVCGDTRAWLDDPSVRDIPHPGERIRADHPVVTVFAEGIDSALCYDALVRRANAVYGALEAWAVVAV
jgi:predicted ATP-grasp superfamily ATP-dependent carboligase